MEARSCIAIRKICTFTHRPVVSALGQKYALYIEQMGIHNTKFYPQSSICLPVMQNQNSRILVSHRLPYFCMIRFKYKKSKPSSRLSDDDIDTTDDDVELEAGSDFRDVELRVPSLRLDSVVKAGLNLSRQKVEEAFYASLIRLNGNKVLKKSQQVSVNDEIDLIRNKELPNPDLLHISRIEIRYIKNYDENRDRVSLIVRKYPKLIIAKYL